MSNAAHELERDGIHRLSTMAAAPATAA